jgi:hypothetical protein
VRLDARRSAVLLEVLAEARRTADNLASSLRRLEKMFPLSADRLGTLDEDEKDRLDAFRVRFSDLQDVPGGKLFRSVLLAEEEESGSMLDTLDRMEKRGIIRTVDDWRRLRDARNLLTHEYPRLAEEQAEALNTAYRDATALIGTLDALVRYVRERLGLAI